MQILVGCDPEIFMFKDGKPVSAHNAVPGTKYDPYPVDRGAVQVDGMALEFNINPSHNEQEFVESVEAVLKTLRSMVPGYELVPTPVAEFGFDYIKQQPREALELGCDPDYNAWENGAVNPKPDGNNPFRTGAGHVHIGWTQDASLEDEGHRQAGITLTKQLDGFLALPSLFYDHDVKRRSMYGAAGAFRTKPYGVEYRVLSNAWLRDNKLMSWVYKNTIDAVQRLLAGERVFEDINGELLSQITSEKPNLNKVEQWLKDHQIQLPPVV